MFDFPEKKESHAGLTLINRSSSEVGMMTKPVGEAHGRGGMAEVEDWRDSNRTNKGTPPSGHVNTLQGGRL